MGLLEQLGMRGCVELQCGSHVSRLLSKLPHDLISSFERFIHSMRVAIPTLVDFAEWLEYELEVQESMRHVSYKRQESYNKKKGNRRDSKQNTKTTTVPLGTETTEMQSPSSVPSAAEPSANNISKTEKGKAYCPYCDKTNIS